MQTDCGFELLETKDLDTCDECVFSSATGIFSSSTFLLVLVTDFRGNVFLFQRAFQVDDVSNARCPDIVLSN